MPALARFLVALYPPEVRSRYGDEIADLLAGSPTPARDAWDVARSAAAAWFTRPPSRLAHPILATVVFGMVWFLQAPDDFLAALLAYLLWLTGAFGLMWMVRRRTWRAVVATAIGVVVFTETLAMAWMGYHYPPLLADPDAWTWLPTLLTGLPGDLLPADFDPLTRSQVYPAGMVLLLPCLVFALTAAYRAAAPSRRDARIAVRDPH